MCVGGDVAVDAVDTAVYAYAAVDLVVGKADLRGRGEGGGLASGAARDDATRTRDGRRGGRDASGCAHASGESERARTIAGLEMHCMTSVVASRARSADATRGRECPHAAGGGERVPAGVLTHTRERLGSQSWKKCARWRENYDPARVPRHRTPPRGGQSGTRARRIDAHESLGGEPRSPHGRNGHAIDVSSERYTSARRCVPRMGCPSRAVALRTRMMRARESIRVGVRVRPQNSGEMAARGTHLTTRSHERATVHGLREPPLGSWPARPPRAPRWRMRVAFLAERKVVTPARSDPRHRPRPPSPADPRAWK